MLKRLWQWIIRNTITRYHAFQDGMTPEDFERAIEENLQYAEEQLQLAKDRYAQAQQMYSASKRNIKKQRQLILKEFNHHG